MSDLDRETPVQHSQQPFFKRWEFLTSALTFTLPKEIPTSSVNNKGRLLSKIFAKRSRESPVIKEESSEIIQKPIVISASHEEKSRKPAIWIGNLVYESEKDINSKELVQINTYLNDADVLLRILYEFKQQNNKNDFSQEYGFTSIDETQIDTYEKFLLVTQHFAYLFGINLPRLENKKPDVYLAKYFWSVEIIKKIRSVLENFEVIKKLLYDFKPNTTYSNTTVKDSIDLDYFLRQKKFLELQQLIGNFELIPSTPTIECIPNTKVATNIEDYMITFPDGTIFKFSDIDILKVNIKLPNDIDLISCLSQKISEFDLLYRFFCVASLEGGIQ